MSNYYGASDLQAMLDEFGVPVVFGIYETKGIFEQSDSAMLPTAQGAFAGKTMQLKIKTGALPGIAEGSQIAVDGANYQVVSVYQVDDGALCSIICTPA